jgi:hypothetical protein
VAEVTPFSRGAIYRITVAEDRDSTATCKQFETERHEKLQVERNNLTADFLHFVRVCVYFDEGDSGTTSLVLKNDSLFLAVSKETIASFQ